MRRLLIVAASVVLVAGACGTEDPALAPDEAAENGEPRLRVLAPDEGATLTLPFELSFEVTGFPLGDPPDGHIHVAWGDPEEDFVPVEPQEQAGTIMVDGVPEGTHDLTIALANANHTVPDLPGATVTLRGITIQTAGADVDDGPGPDY